MVLEMSVEEQMERVRRRNGGSQHVVNLMKVGAVKFISARIWKQVSVWLSIYFHAESVNESSH